MLVYYIILIRRFTHWAPAADSPKIIVHYFIRIPIKTRINIKHKHTDTKYRRHNNNNNNNHFNAR